MNIDVQRDATKPDASALRLIVAGNPADATYQVAMNIDEVR